jgi:hypothetical protein
MRERLCQAHCRHLARLRARAMSGMRCNWASQASSSLDRGVGIASRGRLWSLIIKGLMRLSCSHPVLLHRLAEPKSSAMICNALYDILIN